jgi:hypothetical protein
VFIIIQIGFLLAAICAVFEEWAFTWPFREIDFYSSPELDRSTKKKLSLMFHRWGNGEVVIYAAIASASAFFLYEGLLNQILHFTAWLVSAGLIYMVVFNCGYSYKLGKGFFYLGNTAEEDIFFTKTLGKNAGIYLIIASILILAAINYFNYSYLK